MNNSRATRAPLPTSLIAGNLPRIPHIVLPLVFAQVLVRHVKPGKPATDSEADGPGQDNSPENPVGNPEHESQAVGRSAITKQSAVPDRVRGSRTPEKAYKDCLTPRMAHRISRWLLAHGFLRTEIDPVRVEIYRSSLAFN